MVRITVKSIVPKRVFRMDEFQDEIISTMKGSTDPLIKADYNQTVKGWKHKPDFKGDITSNPNFIKLWVRPIGSNANQYNLVVRGSPPHIITPRNPQGTLSFRTGYIPATRRGSLKSRSPRFAGTSQPRFVKVVRHPGFEPRAFYNLIAENQEKRFVSDMTDAMRRAATRLNAFMR